MHNIIAFYHAIPPQAWTALFGGGSVAAIAVELAKRLGKIKQVPKNFVPITIHALTTVASALLAFIPVLLHHPETMQVFGAYGATIFAGANILYSIVKAVSPVLQSIYTALTTSKPSAASTLPQATDTPTYEG